LPVVTGWRLGIDYGSSHTVAVLGWPDGRTRTLVFGASPLLSSAVYADPGGDLLVGPDAVTVAQLDPGRLERHPKRQIDAGEVWLGDRQVRVADLIAATLRRVGEEAGRVAGQPPDEVVLTHPAGWGPTRRATLRAAAQAAGLAAPTMVAEPVAAAAYFLNGAAEPIPDGAPLVIFDLGGGTFDVSAVRRTGEGFEILGSDGVPDLGGVDLDAVMVDLVGQAVEGADPESWARLRAPSTAAERRHFHTLWESARLAKESLSRRPNAAVAVPLMDREAHVTREQFEHAAAPILRLTVDQTVGMLHRVGLRAGDLAGIFLVGGATRTPLVATLLHQATGRPPTVLDQPELVVAEGALRTAATLAPTAAPAGSPPQTALADEPGTLLSSGQHLLPATAPTAASAPSPVTPTPSAAPMPSTAPALGVSTPEEPTHLRTSRITKPQDTSARKPRRRTMIIVGALATVAIVAAGSAIVGTLLRPHSNPDTLVAATTPGTAADWPAAATSDLNHPAPQPHPDETQSARPTAAPSSSTATPQPSTATPQPSSTKTPPPAPPTVCTPSGCAAKAYFVANGDHLFVCDDNSDGYGAVAQYTRTDVPGQNNEAENKNGHSTCVDHNMNMPEGAKITFRICLLKSSGTIFNCSAYLTAAA
jgi:hypothetical protein